MNSSDILIIGAGPVGSYLAYKLAEVGLEVTLLEQKKEPSGKPACTGIISEECVLNYSFDQDILIKPLYKGIFHSPAGEQIVVNSNNPKAYLIDRKLLEVRQWEKAQKNGVRLLTGFKVINILTDEKKALVEVEGNQQTFVTKLVVIASGFNPTLTEQARLGSYDDYVFGAQAEVESEEEDLQVFFNHYYAPGFFGWLVPVKEDKTLIGILSRRNTLNNLNNFYLYLHQLGKVKQYISDKHVSGIPLSPLKRTYANRIIAVGDSAGQIKPTTGGGIYFGLICADIAFEVILEGLKTDDYSKYFFSKYEKKWKEKLGGEIRQELLARKIFETLDDNKINSIISLINRNNLVVKVSNKDDLSFDWHGKIIKKIIKEISLGSFF